MPGLHSIENEFLNKITEIIEENISNERFGVSELARETGMSRSNLLRKINKLTRISASQFIRQARLKKAMEMLRYTSSTVSEISYEVGFSSPSYFIKCFRDYYGYPPGEAGKGDPKDSGANQKDRLAQSHQLAAIMFTDIQGYTALMQQNEEKAIEFRNRHREVFNTVTRKFSGRILQYYGDGTLSTFSSAIDAVYCGIEMQLAFREEPQIPVKIGIHSGDVIFTEEEIIGDGVNVASRIESLASAGSVLISEKVYDEVKNQSGIQTTSMGKFELKNVDKAMEVFAVTNAGLAIPDSEKIKDKLKHESIGSISGLREKVKRSGMKWTLGILAVISGAYLVYTTGIFQKASRFIATSDQNGTEKSIAVLPFINDSNDSTNVYIINGLMESILNNLQKIKDLRVISRTSVEKYRTTAKTIPEIARELNVNYLIEGSGQKIGNQILLNIQLIDAESDRHIWSEQYNRDATDIFKLQMEVAKKIANEIQVIITPETEEMINKLPTDDLVAYDYFLKGLDLLNNGRRDQLEDAIANFEKAIEHDNEFAHAHAGIAMSYYFLDLYQADKQYNVQINNYADNALLLDPQLPQAFVAKALHYMNIREYEQAIPYFEKALEYNPNYDLAIGFLADLYVNYLPDTEKYLEYALRGIKIDITAYDSVTASIIYLHVSNALIQSGFVNEAEKYVNKSLECDPGNLYAEYVKAYILYAKNRDLQQTKELLIAALNKDTTRYDILIETGKICYFMRDYSSAYHYFKRFIDIREALNLNVYRSEDAKIGFVLLKMGFAAESEKYFNDYLEYAENDNSIYKDLSLSVYYSYKGDAEKALEQLRLFSEQTNYHYWIILFLKLDPLMDPVLDLPEFEKIFDDIETKFLNYHNKIRASLDTKNLL